ncbi:MAG: PASTA domain-containing protein [Acidobacteriota bacterium]
MKKILKIIGVLTFFGVVSFISMLITMNLLIKGDEVDVPDLRGESLEKASYTCSKLNLFLKKRASQYHPDFPLNTIIYQDPLPGLKIKRNKSVKVTISLGSEKVIVPDLAGKTLRAAEIMLGETGLLKGEISQTKSYNFPSGSIIAQEPMHDVEVKRGSSVNILVSSGTYEEELIMPDLIGKKLNSVISQIEGMGFKIGDISKISYPGIESGIIIRQMPLSGWKMIKKNLISLEVSS